MNTLNRFIALLAFALFVQAAAAQERGIASYYSDDFQGNRTASGQAYDKNKLTAAHKMHPMGTKVKVTRLDNKKSVVVTINDRGPYISGRIIELSRAAAQRIDLLRDGSAEVMLEVVGKEAITETPAVSNKGAVPPAPAPGGVATKTTTPPATTGATTTPATVPAKVEPPATKPAATPQPAPATIPKTTAKSPANPQTEGIPLIDEKVYPLVRGDEYKKFGLYKIALHHSANKGFAVQVMSLSSYEAVMQQIADLQGKWFDNILVSAEKGADNQPDYKILLGPFQTEDQARNYMNSLKKKYKMSGFVVDLSAILY